MNTLLFSFTDLKQSTKNTIAILRDTLNTTSCPLRILDPHVIQVSSNALKRHLIGSRVVDGVHNLVINSNMAKLVGFPTNSTFTYHKGTKNTSLMDLLFSKGIVDIHSLHKISHSFSKVVPIEITSIATKVAIVNILSQQSRWEDIHLEW
jgi:uncharacterized radical SAM superfamily protein